MDFLEQIGVSDLFLLITSLLNLFMGGVVWFRKGIKSKMFLYFVVLAFFNFVWAISLFFTLISSQVYLAEFWYRTCYLGALGIAPALLYFAIHFPFQSQKIARVYNIVLGVLFVSLFFLIYSKWHITSFVKINDTSEIMVNYYKPVYFLYSIYFIVLVVYAMKILYDKFRASEGIIRYQIIVLLITILVGLIFGFYFDLLLIYFHDFTYVWLGPLFTLPMNLAVFYLIFFDRKQ